MRTRRSWAGFGLQCGLLVGAGLAFVGGAEPPRAAASPSCFADEACTFKRPLLMIVVDYSTSMNTQFAPNLTRWGALVQAIQGLVDHDNGYLEDHAVLGLMRFGHDADPLQPGSLVPGDASQPPLVDGQAIDVPLYDADAPDKPYAQCNGDAIRAALDPNLGGTVPAPKSGQLTGIGTWTKGALAVAHAHIEQAWSEHPNESKPRPAAVLLITDGEWTDPSGTMKLSPADQDPAITADAMFTGDAIPTYVVAIGEALGKMFADQLATAGGTGQAIDAINPDELHSALLQVAADIDQVVVQPACAAGLPRIMVLLDASSSMLNVMGGTMAGKQGETAWDQVRDALAGPSSLFDQPVLGAVKLESVALAGLAVFGHNMPAPGEQKIVVDYGPCRKDNLDWALDPNSSCSPPGCLDPWGGPPITWTFLDGSQLDPPVVDETTISHMPRCDQAVQVPNACLGSGTYTHLGLQLVDQNIAEHRLLCEKPGFAHPCAADTTFVNVLITDGIHNSTDAQVQAALEGMYAEGVKTYVIGFGDLVNTQAAIAKLNNMAAWGSGGTESYFDANNQLQLEVHLQAIVAELPLDPCCAVLDCHPPPPPPPPPCCGNGVVQQTCNGDLWYEECDDGNNVDGDGCSEWCLIEPGDTSTGTTGPDTGTSGDPTTTTGTSTGGTSTGGTSTGGTSTGDASTGDASTGGTSTTGGPDCVTSCESSTGATITTGSAASSTGDATTAEDGCGCVAEERSPGALAAWLALGLLRRRRRA